MPAEPSRLRSRRARSAAGNSSSAPSSSSAGSAAIRSTPGPAAGTSSTHRSCSRSVPDRVRTKATRPPPGATAKARGAPSVNLCVLACCRGNERYVISVTLEGASDNRPRICGRPG